MPTTTATVMTGGDEGAAKTATAPPLVLRLPCYDSVDKRAAARRGSSGGGGGGGGRDSSSSVDDELCPRVEVHDEPLDFEAVCGGGEGEGGGGRGSSRGSRGGGGEEGDENRKNEDHVDAPPRLSSSSSSSSYFLNRTLFVLAPHFPGNFFHLMNDNLLPLVADLQANPNCDAVSK